MMPLSHRHRSYPEAPMSALVVAVYSTIAGEVRGMVSGDPGCSASSKLRSGLPCSVGPCKPMGCSIPNQLHLDDVLLCVRASSGIKCEMLTTILLSIVALISLSEVQR